MDSRCLLWFLESWVDDSVGLHGRDGDVGDPEADKDGGGDGLDGLGTAQLAAHGGVAPDQQDADGDQSLHAENGHGEAQASGLDEELFTLGCPVDGCHGPRDADAEEDVDGVGTGHVADRVVGSLVLDGSHFTGESVRNRCAESHEGNGIDGILKENEAAQVTGNVTDNSSANTNHGNGNDEARVTVGNACGWNDSEHDLPDEGQEVHDVVSASWHLLLSVTLTFLLLVIITSLNSESINELIFPR